jgi:hypothetical protein
MKTILKKNYNFSSLLRRNCCDWNYEAIIINYLNKHKSNIIINCASEVGSLGFIKRNPANMYRNNSKIYLNLYETVRKSKKKIYIFNYIPNC